MLDPTSCSPLFESSGTAFFTFFFAWGVNQGLLDSDIFADASRKAWKALIGKCVHQESGRVANVQPIGASPEMFNPNTTEPYGAGGILLAGRQMLILGLRGCRDTTGVVKSQGSLTLSLFLSLSLKTLKILLHNLSR